MHKLVIAICVVVSIASGTQIWAQTAQPASPPQLPNREIRVPIDDLPVLLSGANQRMFMTRDEYDALIRKANATPEQIKAAIEDQLEEKKTPINAVVMDAAYTVQVRTGRAEIVGDISIEVLKKGLQAIPLRLQNVGLISVTLDGEPAMLTASIPDPSGAAIPGAVLFVDGPGKHQLQLRMVAAVSASAAQQTLNIVVPHASTNRWTMMVPGNVEILSGASVRTRQVDSANNMTEFSLIPIQSNDFATPITIVMTLNNKMLRDTRTLESRSTMIDEITESYEQIRLHTVVNVLNGAENKFQFSVPTGFEISQVVSPLLSRWNTISKGGDAGNVLRVLEIEMREAVTDQVEIDILAAKLSPVSLNKDLNDWKWPTWNLLDAESQTAILGIQVEEGLQLRNLNYSDLIPIDTRVLDGLLSTPLAAREATAPKVRSAVALYSPVADQSISSQIEKPKYPVRSSLLLHVVVNEAGAKLRGTLDIQAANEGVANVELECNADWRLLSAAMTDGTVLPYYVTNVSDSTKTGNSITRIQLVRPIAPKSATRILFEYSNVPAGWLTAWNEHSFAFPKVTVRDTETGRNLLSSSAEGDLSLTTQQSENLLALFDSERPTFQIPDAGIGNGPAFSANGTDWKLDLAVTRNQPKISAEIFSFFKIAIEEIRASYELHLDIQQASTDQITFSVPESSPSEISIRGLADVVVKESTSQLVDGRRVWTVKLAKRITGDAKLLVDFSFTGEMDLVQSMPSIRVKDAVFQTGVVAIEGDDALDILITKHPRTADVGELTESSYQLGSRLLGVYGYAQNEEDQDIVSIQASPRKLQSIPTTIVQRANVSSALSGERASYHVADLQLKTVGGFLHVQLPVNATLWSVTVDGNPTLPQRKGEMLVVEVRAAPKSTFAGLHSLVIAYETSVNPVGFRNNIAFVAPKLFTVATEASDSVPIPNGDLKWEVWIPGDLQVVNAAGDLQIMQSQHRPTFPFTLADTLSQAFQIGQNNVKSVSMDSERWSIVDAPTSLGDADFTDAESKDFFRALPNQPAQESPLSAKPLPQLAVPQSKSEPEAGQVMREKNNMDSQRDIDGRVVDYMQQTTSAKGKDARAVLTPGLEGLRTLPIQFERPVAWHAYPLIGYSDDASMQLSIVNDKRLEWLASAMAAIVVLLGLCTIAWPLRVVLYYATIAMLVAIAIPLISPWQYETGFVAGYCFYAILVTLCLKIVLSILVRCKSMFPFRSHAIKAGVVATTIALLVAMPTHASGQETAPTPIASFDELVKTLQSRTSKGTTPLEIPADSILVPYNPKSPPMKSGTEMILVPYSVYTQLWNLANPDAQTMPNGESVPPNPIEYLLSNMRYQSSLDRDDYFAISMEMDITLNNDRSILIPFGFAGAVLTQSSWDNKPAVVRMTPNALVVVGQGKGKHTFRATFHLPIQRQGGWRMVNATLPSAPAGRLQLSVPVKDTEVRWLGLPDAEQRETNESDQKLETAFPRDGVLTLQWRPKVTENNTDQGLSATTNYRLNVEEFGLRAVWDTKLEFRRGRRDQFEFEVPASVLVERIQGKNIRGWTVATKGEKQLVSVTLLKSAAESEQMTIIASQSKRLGLDTEQSLVAPQLLVPDAMLQQGRLLVYRSNLLELETTKNTGLVREDVPADAGAIATPNPVMTVPFQAYRYNAPGFELVFKVNATALKLNSQSQTSLRVSRNDAQIAAQIQLTSSGRPLYRVRIEVPSNWKWKTPQCGHPWEWTLSDANGDVQVYDFQWKQGHSEPVAIMLSAEIQREQSPTTKDFSVALPRIRVLEATKDQGMLQVYADPSFDVRGEQFVNCQSIGTGLAERPQSQSVQAQQAVAIPTPPRLQIRTLTGDYSGVLQFVARTPKLSVLAISNVKVTRRSLEETIYLEWNIQDAGIQKVEFTLPGRFKDAVVLAQMARRIQRLPASEQASAPVRFVLDLQEDVMGQYRVVVQQDSPLPRAAESAAIPSKISGTIDSRLITLENSGQDELLVDSLSGVTPLARGDSQWVRLSALLGGKSAEVYRVDDRAITTAMPNEPQSATNSDGATVTPTTSAAEPKLIFKTQSRNLVETVTARVGLSKTVIAVDTAGNYRASQEYRIENTSEPYLEVELPANAHLWTALVAGSPVKPMESPNKSGRAGGTRMRLPLIRTQTGDLDYGVELKYAGKVSKTGLLTQLDFPLIESININVELSQVKVLLPEDQHWYAFAGTLGQVNDDAEFMAGWLAQKNKQLQRLAEIAANESERFAKARAEENLKLLCADVKQQIDSTQVGSLNNDNLQKQLAINSTVFQQIQKQEAKAQVDVNNLELGNRAQFNSLFENQSNFRANGNVDTNDPNAAGVAGPATGPAFTNEYAFSVQNNFGVIPPNAKPDSPQDGQNRFRNSRTGKSQTREESNDNRALSERYRSKLQNQPAQMGFSDATKIAPPNEPFGGGGMSGMGGPGGMGSLGGMQNGNSNLGGGAGGRPGGAPNGPTSGGPMAGGPITRSNNAPNKKLPADKSFLSNGEDQTTPNLAASTLDSMSITDVAGTKSNDGYLASLNVDFEPRGRVYYFTTPRGDITLTASGIAKSWGTKSLGLVALLLAAVVAFSARRLVRIR